MRRLPRRRRGRQARVGPQLNEIFGRTAGTAEGYKYSKAMIEPAKAAWSGTMRRWAQYLASPKGMIKGTKMAFAGLKKDDEIANVSPI
jgi:cytochrome c2